MAGTLQFDLVSPERMLASFEATEVEIPGAEGDFTAMADHAAVVTTMRPGILKASGTSEKQEFVVSGGFVEVTSTGASVLAEVALPRSDVTRAALDDMIASAQAAADKASPEKQDAADKRLADTIGLGDTLGL